MLVLSDTRRHEERPAPGTYPASAHDYRPDLPDFIRDFIDRECTDEQLVRIKDACREREEFREAIFS